MYHSNFWKIIKTLIISFSSKHIFLRTKMALLLENFFPSKRFTETNKRSNAKIAKNKRRETKDFELTSFKKDSEALSPHSIASSSMESLKAKQASSSMNGKSPRSKNMKKSSPPSCLSQYLMFHDMVSPIYC